MAPGGESVCPGPKRRNMKMKQSIVRFLAVGLLLGTVLSYSLQKIRNNGIKKIPAGVIILIILMAPMSAVAYDDANSKEVGVEWVQNFAPCGYGNLVNTIDAQNFYNALGTKGWTRNFNWGTTSFVDNAWEDDYEKASVGGWDTDISGGADTVDFAYFSGHGSPEAFYFGTNHDGDGSWICQGHMSEVSWGETDLEWIVLAGCNIIQQYSGSGDVFQRWGPALQGAHLILSYETIAYDINRADRFVFWMTKNYWDWPWGSRKNIRNAWFQANIDEQPSNVWSAVLGTDRGWDDYLPGYGSQGADGTNGWWYWQKVQS